MPRVVEAMARVVLSLIPEKTGHKQELIAKRLPHPKIAGTNWLWRAVDSSFLPTASNANSASCKNQDCAQPQHSHAGFYANLCNQGRGAFFFFGYR